MALRRVWIPSPNHSSRGGSSVRLVVIHTAEGSTSYQSLGSFFSSSSSGVSSHTGIDDTPNTVGEYVRRGDKAWTQANANPYSVATELCGFASWGPGDWDRHPTMLENCARWIAEECAHYGIPLVKLNASQAQGGQRGVCGHVDLGSSGGGHWDPGPDFPWGRVMDMAKGGTSSTPPPPPKPTYLEANMVCQDPVTGGNWCVSPVDGHVEAFGAPYLGGLNSHPEWNALKVGKVAGIAPYGTDADKIGYRIWVLREKAHEKEFFAYYTFPRDGSQKT